MDVRAVVERYPAPAGAFELDAFCGTWQIVKTSLPFWRKRLSPAITYTALPTTATRRLDDDVRFFNVKGRERHVRGVDGQSAAHPRLFRWRGQPWYLRWTTSDWCVLEHDPACAVWAVTYFAPTLFTPAGIDIYARQAELDPAIVAAIEERLGGQPQLAQFVPALFRPQRRSA